MMGAVFTVEEPDHVRDHVLELARNDSRVVAGADVGSLALGGGDRWSDLDLTFGVTDGLGLTDVLHDWTRDLISRFDAVHILIYSTQAWTNTWLTYEAYGTDAWRASTNVIDAL
jgi:hypothetical protein